MVQVTWSDVAGVIAYLKALISDGFYYSMCWNLPMIEKLSLPNFMFYVSFLPSRPTTAQESSSQISHHFR